MCLSARVFWEGKCGGMKEVNDIEKYIVSRPLSLDHGQVRTPIGKRRRNCPKSSNLLETLKM